MSLVSLYGIVEYELLDLILECVTVRIELQFFALRLLQGDMLRFDQLLEPDIPCQQL